ncbi:hypothetical protein GZH53_18870 [Flavihumibacter sp. R14]|nr:hypothetical protein [Flavihumibacter soli]
MRYLLCLLTFIICAAILSCSQSADKSEQAGTASTRPDINVQCYRAVFEKDTADLRIIKAPDGKVKGTLVMAYGEVKPNAVEKTVNSGDVQGSFKGDTLYLTYTYKTGSINKAVYTNPLALLKKGETLIMGVGDAETSMGRTYFVKGKPIDYEIGRFRFQPAKCKD